MRTWNGSGGGAWRRATIGAIGVLLLVGAACRGGVPGVPPSPGADADAFRLPALRAVPDPVNGGRIEDAHGRHVLLRGVNVNANAEYWAYDPAIPTTYPLTETDAEQIAAMGWNAVRLLLSWSRVEPAPGVYDAAYLDQIESAIVLLQRHGLYSIVDLHQDAWGPSLAARPDEDCRRGERPAFGWDGAPEWATLDAGARRCYSAQREFNPAVIAAFNGLFGDLPGPGGVGIRARYTEMLRHVAGRLAQHDAVAGFEIINEPNAFAFVPGQMEGLAALYAEAVPAIRAGEAAAGAPRRLIFFEPSITWGQAPATPEPFTDDDQLVYAPHLYQGGLDSTPLDETPFERAASESAELYGGAPVLSGEWGAGPERAENPADDYFLHHQRLQDDYLISATLWTWREACGDPHKAGDVRDGRIPYVWGLFEIDCTTGADLGMRDALAAQLRRPALRAVAGRITRLAVDPDARSLAAEGESDARGSFVAFVPGPIGRSPRVSGEGVESFAWKPAPGGGTYVSGWLRAGAWRLEIAPGS